MSTASVTSSLYLSDLAPGAVQSEIRAMSVACNAIGGINMSQGVCDTDPPHEVVKKAIESIQAGLNTYTRLEGVDVLRQAIAKKLERYNKFTSVQPDEVLVTSGATGGLHATCMALLNPGDEVIVFEPFYGYHISTLISLRLKPVIVPLGSPKWDLDTAALEQAITQKTRAILINTPGNPSGKVFTRAELEALSQIAIDRDLFVFTDEIYEYFLYDGREHVSLATLPGMAERTITISGFSKTFSVTGWRLGYLHANPRWIGPIGYFHDLTYVCAPGPLQYGAAAGLLELPNSFYAELSSDHQKKRDMTLDALTTAGLTPLTPDGAYYILADSSRIPGADAKVKARALLAATGVAAVAGTAFFRPGHGENLLRFCYAKKDNDLQEACKRLRAY